MKKFIFSTLLALVLAPLSASANFDQCNHLFPKSAPAIRASATEVEVCSPGGNFATLYDTSRKIAVFSVEYLTPAHIKHAKTVKRTGEVSLFFEETQLFPEHRAGLSDYYGQQGIYDRGHLVPWADFGDRWSNSLINVVPQNSHMNREPWAVIEKSTRAYVLRSGNPIHVWTGVVYGSESEVIGNGVSVPSHFFKLVYDPTEDRSWAYWMPNSPAARVEEPITKEELERRVGLRFF